MVLVSPGVVVELVFIVITWSDWMKMDCRSDTLNARFICWFVVLAFKTKSRFASWTPVKALALLICPAGPDQDLVRVCLMLIGASQGRSRRCQPEALRAV